MVVFEDIQDIRDWLDPLDFDAFWSAIEPWAIFEGGDRAHFDQVLSRGITDVDTVLICLKAEARVALTERFGLKERCYVPTDAQYLRKVH
ncbi:hypothetical protein [Shimia sp. MMG029]|uniref:hypothetical protein n=1 Tax=Shimia sp. MMG029 TaxID=3021978 RepID=UPI0022FE062C|nr:hypothetical protein [Shimia sp. MMG029]MDA5556057.1 hypothetical protein [Shimia sp. MMG029]